MTALLAASLTYVFTAFATGLEKGAPVEFLFTSKGSDRDYESMFLVDESVLDFCNAMEKAGFPRGKAAVASQCILWPAGCTVSIKPEMSRFIDTSMPEGYSKSEIIYTGGARDSNGCLYPESTNSHSAVFALYSLPASPIVFNGIYPQGDVYGVYTAKEMLKKGEKVTFTVTWDGKTKPREVVLSFNSSNPKDEINRLKELSMSGGELDVLATFSGDMTLREAKAVANSLATVDSKKIKINGAGKDGLFYRAFLPLVKWTERSERLLQPFELTITPSGEKLVYIDEDWSQEGIDPVLTEKTISFDEAKKFDKITTCFIYASADEKLSRIYEAKGRLKSSKVVNWYVFEKN